jgi:hypothetical protein
MDGNSVLGKIKDWSDCRDGKHNTEQKQDYILRLREECFDLIHSLLRQIGSCHSNSLSHESSLKKNMVAELSQSHHASNNWDKWQVFNTSK